jgi:hypothetical protein
MERSRRHHCPEPPPMESRLAIISEGICSVAALRFSLSPGIVPFLYGSDHMNQRRGIFAVIAAVVLLAIFIRTAAPKGTHALIDLQLFKSQVFAASAATQFM